MNNQLILDQNEDSEKKVVPLKLLPGGKDGNENWLRELGDGDVFLAELSKVDPRQGKQLDLQKYIVLNHYEVTTALVMCLPDGREMTTYVRSLEFSRAMRLVEVLVKGNEIVNG